MGLFDRFVQWRTNSRIHALEQSLTTRPTPMLYLQLADAHKMGNQSKSAQVLKLGAARFPTAPEIVRRQAEAEKIEREMEKKRIVDKIQSHPNPILYARLAELYKADDEMNKTIDTCQRGIKAFPKYGGTYLVLGQIYAEKRQWPEAMQQLEKSVALDKYNYLALKLLAQVYLEIGRPEDAAQRLEDILYFAPGDESIIELIRKARDSADALNPNKSVSMADATAKGKAAASAAQPVQVPRVGSKNLTGIAAASLARSSAIAATKSTVQKAPSTKDQLYAKGLADLRAVTGVLGAILVDQYGLIVASDLDGTIDEGLAGAMITNVYRTASNNAVKLGVGQFEEGFIEGADGNIHVVQFDDMILTVFAKPEVKAGLLEKSIRDFAAVVFQKK